MTTELKLLAASVVLGLALATTPSRGLSVSPLEHSLLMSATLLFVIVLALAWYNVGTIWAHEVDIFRTWRLVPAASFHAVQTAHWHKLPYWVLLPVGLTLLGSTALVWYHPPLVPRLALAGNAACQLLSAALTGLL